MTVKELKNRLQGLNDEMKVTRTGYQGGLEDIYDIRLLEVTANFDTKTSKKGQEEYVAVLD